MPKIIKSRFSPLKLPGLAAWYDASDNSTVLSQSTNAANFVKTNYGNLRLPEPNNIHPGTSPFTYTFWGYLNDTTGLHEFINYGESWPGSASGRFLIRRESSANQVTVEYRDNNNIYIVNRSYYNTANEWFFCEAGWDGNNLFIRINNGTLYTTSASTPIKSGDRPLSLGNRFAGDTINGLNGRMAMCGYWKRTLTNEERTFLYNNGIGRLYNDLPSGLKTNLISYWNLTESSGTRYDSHGTNHLIENNGVGAAIGPYSTKALDGHNVRRWISKNDSSIFFDQPVLTNQPMFTKTTSALTFNGLSSFMDGTTTMSNLFRNRNNGYIFLVAQDTNPTSGSTHHVILFFSTNISATRIGLFARDASINEFRASARRLNSDTVQISNLPNNSNRNILENHSLYQSGTVQLFVNGIEAPQKNFPSGSGPSDNTPSATVKLGSATSTSSFFPGYIHEIILCYDELLSNESILTIRRYLQHKWNIPILG